MDCYYFDKFCLIPAERRLIDEQSSLDVRGATGKCFELLVVLVKSGRRLMTRDALLDMVWGGAYVEPANVDTQVSNLRHILEDEGPSYRVIATVRGTGYRFIAQVTHKNSDSYAEATDEKDLPSDHSFEVEAHRFVPTYIGIPLNAGIVHPSRWGGYREIQYADARLCIPACGIGVWHLSDVMQFTRLTDLAHWRKKEKDAILDGQHAIGKYTATLMSEERNSTHSFLERSQGSFVYTLSAFALRRHGWTKRQLHTALRFASCPRAFLAGEITHTDPLIAHSRELEMLATGFEHPDLREFGVFGTDYGYASWAGVSYYGFGRDTSRFLEAFADFEVALQSIWLFCDLVDKVALDARPSEIASLQQAASTIRNEIRRIQSIGPTDPAEVRMMYEAVFITSRLQAKAEAALTAVAALGR